MTSANGANQSSTYTVKWKKGTDPYEGKWPGPQKGRKEVADGMLIEWDVDVAMRDGARIFVDIFRPQNANGPLPVILTYSSYGKHGVKNFDIFPNSGVPKGSVSKYTAWEGVDPLYWTARGYAVINADSRGSWGSDGNLEILSPQEGQDGYDIVEWAASLEWSNGKVGMAGVSYLAIIQWRVAEINPPHLSCIMPWEGYRDVYKDYTHKGGIPETHFVKFTDWSCQYSLNQVEDWSGAQHEHHLYDDYQQSKCAKLSQINVPAFVVADWGDQGLHTRGALDAFQEISSTEKWLYVHGGKKWQYFFLQSSLDRQEAFFQKFLKGLPSEIDTWPRVLIDVRDRAGQQTTRGEAEWPLATTNHTIQYLDNLSGSMVSERPLKAAHRSYGSEKKGDNLTFSHDFTEETELTGCMRLRLWVSTEKSDDMDLFVQLDKIGADGKPTPFIFMSMIDDGPLALGWLRVSHREVDVDRTTVNRPLLLHQRELKLRRNEIVPCDIEIWPSSTIFHRGESLRLTIQGNDIFVYDLAQCQRHEDSVNQGRHSIYTGGIHESYLVLPYINSKVVE